LNRGLEYILEPYNPASHIGAITLEHPRQAVLS
jgi:hypothetical protein